MNNIGAVLARGEPSIKEEKISEKGNFSFLPSFLHSFLLSFHFLLCSLPPSLPLKFLTHTVKEGILKSNLKQHILIKHPTVGKQLYSMLWRTQDDVRPMPSSREVRTLTRETDYQSLHLKQLEVGQNLNKTQGEHSAGSNYPELGDGKRILKEFRSEVLSFL